MTSAPEAAKAVNCKSCNIQWPKEEEKFVIGERDRGEISIVNGVG